MKSKWEPLKKLATTLEEVDQQILLELVGKLEKRKRISEDEAEEYVDVLLGIAAEVEEDQQELLYRVIEQLQA